MMADSTTTSIDTELVDLPSCHATMIRIESQSPPRLPTGSGSGAQICRERADGNIVVV
jgi:hypothetical protein